MVTTGLASEGGHWYAPDGSPAYQIPSTGTGELRDVTLRDARKLKLVPSVTKIVREAAAPGLEAWKRRQILLSALTLPRIENEGVDAFAKRVQADADAQGDKARALGTQIHAEIEAALKVGLFTSEFAAPVVAWLEAKFGQREWLAERSFTSREGFGGKIDLHVPRLLVVDFKTSDFGAGDKVGGWPEQKMQLAAYTIGLQEDPYNVKVGNVFVSTREPGLIKPYWFTPVDILQGWHMFECLLKYWKLKNDYDPSNASHPA